MQEWISECVGTATSSILVNGSPSEDFPIQRGFRQGDPLYPFLFLLVAEGFNVLMTALMGANLFCGYGVGRQDEVKFSHLQFADGTLIIGEKRWSNVHSMRALLLLFENISGLKVNFNKSVLTSVNVPQTWLSKAASVLNCRTGSILFVFLGLPIVKPTFVLFIYLNRV